MEHLIDPYFAGQFENAPHNEIYAIVYSYGLDWWWIIGVAFVLAGIFVVMKIRNSE